MASGKSRVRDLLERVQRGQPRPRRTGAGGRHSGTPGARRRPTAMPSTYAASTRQNSSQARVAERPDRRLVRQAPVPDGRVHGLFRGPILGHLAGEGLQGVLERNAGLRIRVRARLAQQLPRQDVGLREALGKGIDGARWPGRLGAAVGPSARVERMTRIATWTSAWSAPPWRAVPQAMRVLSGAA